VIGRGGWLWREPRCLGMDSAAGDWNRLLEGPDREAVNGERSHVTEHSCRWRALSSIRCPWICPRLHARRSGKLLPTTTTHMHSVRGWKQRCWDASQQTDNALSLSSAGALESLSAPTLASLRFCLPSCSQLPGAGTRRMDSRGERSHMLKGDRSGGSWPSMHGWRGISIHCLGWPGLRQPCRRGWTTRRSKPAAT